MAYCSKCGTQLSDGAKFCPKCGNPTGSSETKEMAEENSANYCLELVSAGFAKLQVVKALREILDIGLKEAKDMVDSTPLEIAEGLTLTKAKEIASLLSTVGAKTIVKQNGKTIFIEEPSQNVNPQTEEQGGNKLIKYGTYVFAALCFFYIIGTCEGGSSDGQEETQIEQKQESPAEKQDSNPYAKFVGKYVLYDDEGGKGQTFIVASDGRFLQDNSFNESDFKASGYISPKNDKQFEVSLSEKVFGIKQVWSYKNNHTYAKAWDISYNNTLLFDLNEKRMYIDIKEYNNRDYTKPEYYKFRFTKQ